MKKLILLSLPLAIWCLFSFTPKKEKKSIFEGIITYTYSAKNFKDPGPVLDPVTSILFYVKGDMRKQVSNRFDGNDIEIKNLKTPENLIYLSDFMGHKFLTKLTDRTKAILKKQDSARKATMHIITTKETKEIIGYTCNKVILTYVFNRDTVTSTYYCTKKLSDFMYSILPGLPLEFSIPGPINTLTTYSATSIENKPLPDSTFIPSAEYKPVTTEELMNEQMRIMNSK